MRELLIWYLTAANNLLIAEKARFFVRVPSFLLSEKLRRDLKTGEKMEIRTRTIGILFFMSKYRCVIRLIGNFDHVKLSRTMNSKKMFYFEGNDANLR